MDCDRTTTEPSERDNTPFARLHTHLSLCYKILSLIQSGHTLVSAGRLCDLDVETVRKIIKASGVSRRCRRCGKPLDATRKQFCSDECQNSTRDRTKGLPLFTATANVLRHAISDPLTNHAEQAIELAQSFSTTNAAEFLGPCYEAVMSCAGRGITNAADVKSEAKRFVRQFLNDTCSPHIQSLEALKESEEYEPPSYYGDAAFSEFSEPMFDWADLNDSAAKRLAGCNGNTAHLRRYGVDVLARTEDVASDLRVNRLERELRRYRRRLRRGEQPCSLNYPVDNQGGMLPLEKYQDVAFRTRRR